MSADDSFFDTAKSIALTASPDYLEREHRFEEARRTAHEKTYRPGVGYGGMAADPYSPPTDAELIARAVQAERAQVEYRASQVGKANAAAHECEQLLNALAGALSAYRAAVSRAENTISETAAQRATEAGTIGETLAAKLNALGSHARLGRVR